MIGDVDGTDERHDDPDDLEQRIASALMGAQRTAAAAESLTGGNVSAGLSAIEGASDWFVGGVVAYASEVKFGLLGVDRGPVINAPTARQMATGVARLLNADFAVATTGVGGPVPGQHGADLVQAHGGGDQRPRVDRTARVGRDGGLQTG